MARITVEDCLKRVPSRYMLVNMVAKRVRQIREGSEYLVNSPKNEDIVVSLREIAAGKIIGRLKDPLAAAARPHTEGLDAPQKAADAVEVEIAPEAEDETAVEAAEADAADPAGADAAAEAEADAADPAGADAAAEAEADTADAAVPEEDAEAVEKDAGAAAETDKDTVS